MFHRDKRLKFAGSLAFIGLMATGFPADAQPRGQSEWAWVGDDGKLQYKQTPRGDRIPDFSHAGYGGGGVALPEVPVAITLEPEPGDATERLQAAIDDLGEQPLDEQGFRGAILLKAGQYELAGPIYLRHSGIVLRGEGDGVAGTTIRATGTSESFWSRLIDVGAESGQWREVQGTRTEVVDGYVPAGTHEIAVEDASSFAVNDTVIVLRRANEQWVSDLGMNQIPPDPGGNLNVQWEAKDYNYRYDRVITAIDGNVITIDAPLGDAINQDYGGGAVYKYEFPERISNVGIEHLRAVAQHQGRRDEDGDHYRMFVNIDRAENVWVRNVTSYHFGFAQVRAMRRSKWLTVQDCKALDPAAKFGGSRRYGFYLSGQLALVQRCFANEDRHAFAWNQHTLGPNVFLDCHAVDSHVDSGPHHRWSVAGLLDNVRIPNHSIRVQNRLIMGNGHGWAGANFVIWNSRADHFVLHSPPMSQNWAIGVIGKRRAPNYKNSYGGGPHGWGYRDQDQRHWDSHNQPVKPVSLYLKQLEDRLGSQAVRNIMDEPYSFSHQLEPGP